MPSLGSRLRAWCALSGWWFFLDLCAGEEGAVPGKAAAYTTPRGRTEMCTQSSKSFIRCLLNTSLKLLDASGPFQAGRSCGCRNRTRGERGSFLQPSVDSPSWTLPGMPSSSNANLLLETSKCASSKGRSGCSPRSSCMRTSSGLSFRAPTRGQLHLAASGGAHPIRCRSACGVLVLVVFFFFF